VAEQAREILGRLLIRLEQDLVQAAGVDVRERHRMTPGHEQAGRALEQREQLVGRLRGELGHGGARRGALARHHVELCAARIAADCGVRLVDEAREAFAQPVIAPRAAGEVRHALLHHAPAARRREHEGVVIELMPVLHRRVVDLGGELAGLDQRIRLHRQGIANGRDLSWRLPRRAALAAGDVRPKSACLPRTASLSAPHTVVVTPLECQSKPSTHPNAWNQNGSDSRRRTSSAPCSAIRCARISRASRTMRPNSKGGARPVCSGRLATPVRLEALMPARLRLTRCLNAFPHAAGGQVAVPFRSSPRISAAV
jgi:hypothetical protein